MNREVFQWISALVKNKPDQVTSRPISELGRQVQAHYHCGHVRNNRLIFSAEDKRRLRQRVKEELGLDPFMARQLPNDRLEMAKFHANEKLAAKPAGHDYLLLNSPDGMLHLNDEQIRLHPQRIPTAGLFCLNSGLETVEHEAIVVVENLIMMSLCARLPLPPLAKNALWVYRGDHKTGAKTDTCYEFIARFGIDKDVIVFSDMDPKGLEIALTMPFADYWLGPEEDCWHICLQSRYANRDGFDHQNDSMNYLQRLVDARSLTEPLKNLMICLQTERSSYRQEHMYSHNIALDLFPIAP